MQCFIITKYELAQLKGLTVCMKQQCIFYLGVQQNILKVVRSGVEILFQPKPYFKENIDLVSLQFVIVHVFIPAAVIAASMHFTFI